MLQKLIAQANQNREAGTKPISKKDVLNVLQEKGLIKSYPYGISMFNRIDSREQDRISIPILQELSTYFQVSIDEIISLY